MFKLATKPSYIAPVEVTLPGAAKQTFDVEFRRLTQSELDEFLQRVRDNQLTDAEVCREIVLGWRGVSDADGELAFSAGALDALLDIYPLARCIVEAFMTSLAGARAKN